MAPTGTQRALVLFANGFEEIEAITPVDVLRRAGVEVTTAGVGGVREPTGARGVTVRTDTLVEQVTDENYDLLVFPGGMPGAKNLGESAAARAMAERMAAAGKLLAAICAAPVHTLGAWGLLSGKTATCFTGMEGGFPQDVAFSPERVVEDGAVLTSRGAGTAMEFALALAARLAGAETAAKVASSMLAK